MATTLTTVSKGEVLTASKFNDVINLVNDHERRLLAQKITSGTGYTFTQSQGGTSLQITPKGSEEGDETSSTPFRVSVSKGDGDKISISSAKGTIFGLNGNSASFASIDKQSITEDLEHGRNFIVCAKIETEPIILPDPPENTDEASDISIPVVYSIPFTGRFLSIAVKTLDEWQGNALYAPGQEKADDAPGTPPANDYYGIQGGWNVYFPLATFSLDDEGNVQNLTQILHSDLYFYAHWTNSVSS